MTPEHHDQHSSIDLVGRWDIVSYVAHYDDGRLSHPMGERPTGFIRYTADGDFVVMISRADRPNFTSGGQWDANDADKASAYQSILSYAGRYELGDGHVTHHVEFSLYPSWVGGLQRRTLVQLPDGTIALEARLESDTAQARTARLVWRRREGSA